MEPAVLGSMLDSSVLVAAERKKFSTPEMIRKVREAADDVIIVICSAPRGSSSLWLISSSGPVRWNWATRPARIMSAISTAFPA